MNYFIFKGKCSLDEGIIITSMPPIPKPERRVTKITIPGRSGVLYQDEEVYETMIIQIQCKIIEKCNINQIKSWLNGEGDMILSTSPNVFYNANIINKIDYTSIVNLIYEIPLEVELQPFSYSIKEYEHDLVKNSTIYITESTAKILPYIKIEGSGPVTLTINNKSQIIKNINEYIELDSKIEEAYKNNENQNYNVQGNFLSLAVGENKIEWIGSITNLKIKYRETYL